MSRPRASACTVQEIVPGVLRWTVHDERIDYRSDAYAVTGDSGSVLIDPLPLEGRLLETLMPVTSIVLTAGCHQRAAWELRRAVEAPVWAPPGARGVEERPDGELGRGVDLPLGLWAIGVTGPTNPHAALGYVAGDGRRVLFAGDLVMELPGGAWSLVPEEHHEDVEATRRSVRALASAEWSVLCPAHGNPVLQGACRALQGAAATE